MIRRTARSRRGAIALEFGLLAPFLVAITMGLVDYGQYFRVNNKVTNAARDAARVGSLVPLDTEVAPIAELQGHRNLDSSDLEGQVTCELIGFSPDQRIRCDVEATLEPLFGLVPVPNRMRASATMRMEKQS